MGIDGVSYTLGTCLKGCEEMIKVENTDKNTLLYGHLYYSKMRPEHVVLLLSMKQTNNGIFILYWYSFMLRERLRCVKHHDEEKLLNAFLGSYERL